MCALRLNESTIHPDIQYFANFNTCYAIWLAKVDALCRRLLNIELMHLIETEGLDPIEFYEEDIDPDMYFAGVVVPIIEQEQGGGSIDEVIGLEAMWGNKGPP